MADISPHASEILPPCTRSSRVVRRDKDVCAATARSSFPGTLLRSMKTLDKRCRQYSSRCWQSSMIINHCCSAWTRANNHVQRRYVGCYVSVSYTTWQRISHCIALLPSASARTGLRAADDWLESVRSCQSRGSREQRHFRLACASVQAVHSISVSGTVNASSFSVNRCPQIL